MPVVKNLPASAGDMRCGFDPWVRKIPWRRAWQSTLGFLPGKANEHRSLAGYSPWGRKESDTTEHIDGGGGGEGKPQVPKDDETLISKDAHAKPKFLLNVITHLYLGAPGSSLVMPGSQKAPFPPEE